MDIQEYIKDIHSIYKEGSIYFSQQNLNVSFPETGSDDNAELQKNSFWYLHRSNCINYFIQKYSPNSLLFDIGGGNGYVVKSLMDGGISSVLVEPSKDGCLNAQNKGVPNIFCGTIENIPFRKDSLPSIGLFDVIEHIEKDVQFLQKVHKLLQPNGIIYVNVPAFSFLWSNDDVYWGHFRRYTNKTLANVLQKSGFEIVHQTYLFSNFVIPMFLVRVIPTWLGILKAERDPKRFAREHNSKKGILRKLLDFLLKDELNKINKGKKLSWGTSCFIVAKKI